MISTSNFASSRSKKKPNESDKLSNTEQQLKQRIAELEDFLDNGAIGLHWVGPDGTIIWANQADYEPLGYTKEEYIGHNITEFHADKETIADILKRLSAFETLHSYEARLRCKDGTYKYVLITSNVRQEDGKFIHTRCFTRDITERKELEQRKEDFISMASHELNTPLTSMKLLVQTIQKLSEKKGDETIARYIKRVDDHINRLNNLVSGLLDVSRLQGGKFALHKEIINLSDLITEVKETLQPLSTKHTIILEGNTKNTLYADKGRLEQVMINLLSNAMKYSPKADKVIITISGNDKEVMVSVQDFGIGIGSKHGDKVFERFYRVYEGKEKTFPGMGIGLYITSEIIKAHDGRIWLQSENGRGSKFTFVIPKPSFN